MKARFKKPYTPPLIRIPVLSNAQPSISQIKITRLQQKSKQGIGPASPPSPPSPQGSTWKPRNGAEVNSDKKNLLCEDKGHQEIVISPHPKKLSKEGLTSPPPQSLKPVMVVTGKVKPVKNGIQRQNIKRALFNSPWLWLTLQHRLLSNPAAVENQSFNPPPPVGGGLVGGQRHYPPPLGGPHLPGAARKFFGLLLSKALKIAFWVVPQPPPPKKKS